MTRRHVSLTEGGKHKSIYTVYYLILLSMCFVETDFFQDSLMNKNNFEMDFCNKVFTLTLDIYF